MLPVHSLILTQPEIEYIHCEYASAVIDVVNILHYVYVISFMGAGLHIGARTQVVRGYLTHPKFSRSYEGVVVTI